MFNECIRSPIGILEIVSDGSGIKCVRIVSEFTDGRPDRITSKAAVQLEQYFAGKRKSFDVPLNPDGTEYQKTVFRALVKIPFGATETYGTISKTAGGCAQSVGNAVGKNPILIFIPCHRVVAANGIGGFSAGINNKIILHKIEGIDSHDTKPNPTY